MKASVCMASFDRDPSVLRQVLESICVQKPPFEAEVIVADDGSDRGAPDVCGDFPVTYRRIERLVGSRSPCFAHNAAYRLATGDIIIAQSDDVAHQDDDYRAALYAQNWDVVFNVLQPPEKFEAKRKNACYLRSSQVEPSSTLCNLYTVRTH